MCGACNRWVLNILEFSHWAASVLELSSQVRAQDSTWDCCSLQDLGPSEPNETAASQPAWHCPLPPVSMPLGLFRQALMLGKTEENKTTPWAGTVHMSMKGSMA